MHLGISLDRDFEDKLKELKHGYREFVRIDGLLNDKLDPTRFFKSFLASNNVANASIDSNSNVNSQNMPTLLSESHKPLQKLLSYNKIFIEMKEEFGLDVASEFLEKQILGEIYLHDSSTTSFVPYCYAYSLKDIAEKGLFFIKEMKANAPKHLDTFNSHFIEFVSWATNSQAGAVGAVDYLLYSFYFWKKDKENNYHGMSDIESYKYQEFQKVIYALNQSFLKGQQQSAYTNFSIMDREYYVGLFGSLKFPDGTLAIDCIEDFMQYQKDFLNFVKEERNKKSFTFPVLTASMIFKDNKWQDEDMAKFVVKHNMKWADVNIYVSDDADVLSSCCRAQFSKDDISKGKKKLEGNFNSIGGTDLEIGSSKVVTLNLPRISMLAKGEFEKAKEIMKEDIKLIQKFHYCHRKILKKNIDRGLLPVYSFGLMKLENQFATVGVSGLEEYLDVLGGIDYNSINEKKYNKKAKKYSTETLDFINKVGESTIDEFGFTQNVEQIPGESANATLLKKDKMFFGDKMPKKISNKPTYSNQWCGLDSNFSLNDRIKMSGLLDSKTGGGQILHLNLAEDWDSFEDAWNFNTYVAEQGVAYWSEIRKIKYCKNDHNFFGDTCPICGLEPAGDIIKIVGYMTKNEYYHDKRKEELEDRIFYSNKDAKK